MNNQDTIDQFFIQDGQLMPDGLKTKRSVLLALIEDVKFTILLPGKWRPLNLTEQQHRQLNDMLPSFTVISQFCSAVDLLARVTKKQLPPRGENGNYFRDCVTTWFELENNEADQLWLLRNGISHSYRLETGQVANQFGYGKMVYQSPVSGLWHFYLHAMYTQLTKASKRIYESLSSESDADKQVTADYLETNGFFYSIFRQNP